MYPTSYLGRMTLCKEISLTIQTQPGHWNNEEGILQEDMELRGDASSHGASNDPPNKNKSRQ